jgi:hypothetical protein
MVTKENQRFLLVYKVMNDTVNNTRMVTPSALQSYPSVASKNPFYHASNVKYYCIIDYK